MKEIYWENVEKENRAFFEKNTVCELVLSNMCDNRNIGKNRNNLFYIMKFVVASLFAFFNKVRIEKNNKIAVFGTCLNRPNDWGLIWPLVLEMDKRNSPFFFQVSDTCYMNHKKEIQKLKNATILYQSEYSRKLLTCSWKNITNTFKEQKKIKAILKKHGLGNIWEYRSIYIVNTAYANGVYKKMFSNCRFSISLGNRIFGFLYNIYGIKHFGVQHGDSRPELVGLWTPSVKPNIFAGLMYGEYYSDIYRRIFGMKCFSVGHPVLSKENCELNSASKQIVFFSESHAVVNDKQASQEELEKLNETLDEIIEFYNSLPEDYSFYIKLHPNESADYMKRYKNDFGGRIKILDGSIHSIDVLKSSLLAISWGSSVNLEAIKMGCLGIQLVKNMKYFRKQEFSYRVYSLKEVNELLNDKERINEIFEEKRKIADRYIKISDRVEADTIDLTFQYSA